MVFIYPVQANGFDRRWLFATSVSARVHDRLELITDSTVGKLRFYLICFSDFKMAKRLNNCVLNWEFKFLL